MEPLSTPPEASAADLERFRQQWQEEVKAKSKSVVKKPEPTTRPSGKRRESATKPERPINKPPTQHPLVEEKDKDEDDGDEIQSEVIQKIEGLRVREVDEDDFSAASSSKEPKSALEHYEKAVEMESQGILGDSLSHYRKAYRLDASVDKSYKQKHFPTKPQSSDVNPSNQSATVSDDDDFPSKQPEVTLTFPELVNSFGNLTIPAAEPLIEGDTAPPCHIRKLPTEVLLELLRHVAIFDPSIFARLALVCKKLAYHVFTDNSIWKRVALGSEFGLASQRYHFATDIQGREAIFRAVEDDTDDRDDLPQVDESLFAKNTDWREFFHTHPRVRFSGVYISTVNYTRQGGPSATPGTWASTVHIVTYYRYLRFFRDGTVISLLSLSEPVNVVHHLTKENIALIRGGKDPAHPLNFPSSATALLPPVKEGQTLPPSAQNLMKHALKGRWRLCHPSLTEATSASEVGANMGVAGDIHIETEGAGPRYTYTLHLSLKSGSRSSHATKNNKLVWKGFWNYNVMTDDWSEFTLRNDKPFYFSRVKRYGLGY